MLFRSDAERSADADLPIEGYVAGCVLCELQAAALEAFAAEVGVDHDRAVLAARCFEVGLHDGHDTLSEERRRV